MLELVAGKLLVSWETTYLYHVTLPFIQQPECLNFLNLHVPSILSLLLVYVYVFVGKVEAV